LRQGAKKVYEALPSRVIKFISSHSLK